MRPILMGRKFRATIAERLMARIRREFPEFKFSGAAYIMRTRAGYWQRRAVAWRWQVEDGKLYPSVGSQYTMADCLKAKKLEKSKNDPMGNDHHNDWHIDPVEDRAPSSEKGGAIK